MCGGCVQEEYPDRVSAMGLRELLSFILIIRMFIDGEEITGVPAGGISLTSCPRWLLSPEQEVRADPSSNTN